MSTDITPAKPPAERNERGYFAKGNTLGKSGGNPAMKLQASFKRALMEAGSPERVTKLVDGLYLTALGGDTNAAKLLLSYWIGKPTQNHEVTKTSSTTITTTTDIRALVGIIEEETTDPEMRLRIARRMMSIGQPEEEADTDGQADRDSAED